MTRHRAPLLALATALLAGACGDIATPENPAQRSAPPAQQPSAPDPDVLAREIPEFGGYFLDEEGVPSVYLTTGAARGKAVLALEGYARGRGASEVRVLEGRFRYADLSDWHGRINDVLATSGVVYTDLDERSNAVVVGVENAGVAESVRAQLRGRGIPEGAVEIREVEPIRTAATLRDQGRPVVAGLQINYGNYVCTLGFNAGHSAGNSFITNSHCTNTQGGTEGTLYYQSLSTQAGSFIGTEAADPQYFKGGICPKGKKCRYSDAARVSYASGVSFSLGTIASVGAGSLNITGSINLNGEQGNAVVGETVSKIGRTTGLSTGVITNTCVNTSVQGSQVLQLCQNFVSAAVGSGDSGSPVFSGTTLRGILWGGGTSQFVYSPINQVEQELGALTTN